MIELIILVFNPLLAYVNLPVMQSFSTVDADVLDVSSSQALESIRKAEASGADVSDLVHRFNIAMELLQHAEGREGYTCSGDECAVEANRIFISIVSDASSLLSQGRDSSQDGSLLAFALVSPLIALSMTIAGIILYRYWKLWQTKKLGALKIYHKQIDENK